MTAVDPFALSPSEELLLDLLAARHRLGHTTYLVSTRHSRQLRSLAAKGLIWTDSGNVERTMKAGLTVLGEVVALDEHYVAPALSPTCRSFYFGPRSVMRVDCEKRNHHTGKHKATLGTRTVKWTDTEAGGYDDPHFGPLLRAQDQERATERVEALRLARDAVQAAHA